MNLLKDPWIPIQRQSGKQELITPSAITDQNDPVAFLAAPRSDFNGSLMQFLIGLLQTAFAPEFRELKRSQWRRWCEIPPTQNELDKWFVPLLPAFEFDGDGARFMQDLELKNKDVEKKPIGISALLLENPGNNTLKNNTDQFIKRGLIKRLCNSCAITALFNLQINAHEGGVGYRTSLRGGGPLTTLIIEKTYGNHNKSMLWRNLWLNILPTNEVATYNDNNKLQDVFPWLAPTRISEKSQSTTLSDIHPMQIFWNMPRRIRFDFTLLQNGNCDLCDASEDTLLTSYVTKNYGINYDSETFRHPLSPYYRNKTKDKDLDLPKHLQADGLGYNHWLGIALRGEPAKVVSYCNNERSNEIEQLKIWAFGYNTKSAKVLCFYESYLPLYNVSHAIKERFADTVAKFIEAASLVLSFSKSAIKQAWFQSPTNASGNVNISKEFWSDTESEFYLLLGKLKVILESSGDIDGLKLEWLKTLKREAFVLFGRWAESIGLGYENIRRLGIAHSYLCKNLNGPKSKLKVVLDLPKETKNKQ